MNGRHGGVVILILFFQTTRARESASLQTSDLLGYTKGGSNNPLIVIVNGPKKTQKLQDSFDDLFFTGDDGVPNDDQWIYENEAKEQAKYLLYNYLNAPVDSQESSSEDPRPALRQALRQRCQAVVECTSKCEEPKRKDVYCPLNCKAVFDKLNLCEAPKPKRDPCKKKSDECNSWGKTMPPKWLK